MAPLVFSYTLRYYRLVRIYGEFTLPLFGQQFVLSPSSGKYAFTGQRQLSLLCLDLALFVPGTKLTWVRIRQIRIFLALAGPPPLGKQNILN